MHRPRFVLPTFVTALVTLLVAVLIAGPAAAAGSGSPAVAAPAAAYTTTVTNFDSGGNQVVRFDTDGNAVDAHDGMIAFFGGTYYLYGTAYNCGFSWLTTNTPFCGFKVYSSPDLVHWADRGLLFDPTGSVWQTRCNGSTYGCFRPHVVYDAATGMYVLWVNVYDNSVEYRVFTASSPVGPFTEAAVPTLAVNDNTPAGGVNNGDETVFADDDGTAYVVYTDWRSGGDLVVERLNSSYLSGTGAYTRLGQSATEAPALFKRNGVYYLTYSDPNCGYCSGTGTSYRTASSPLGPWSAATKLTTTSCGGQPSFVSAIATTTGTAYLYASDLWDGAHNEALANYYWTPLTFASNGSISPITCQNSFSLALATGAAGSQNQPYGVDQADGVSGFRTYCDLRTGVARFQTFVPSRGGTLSALSYTTFQSGSPNAGLEFDVYQANSSFQPTGTVLSSTVIPASSVGWSPRAVTITPNLAVTAGTRYGFLVKSVASSGCYGLAYSDSSPYPGGGEAYSGNSGSTFSAEAGRSLKFSTSVTSAAVPGASPVQLPAGFTLCATENGTCSSSGTAVIAFGAGSYLYKTVTGSTGCTASAFGGDPAQGVLKACYLAPSGGPSGYTACAAENGTCSFSGTEMVAYGSNGGFSYQLASSGIACSNSNFGDPLPGVAKSCYLPAAGSPAGSWTQCASENGSCGATGTQLIAYGANGAFVYSTSNGPITCSNPVFGTDPIPNVAKSCYQHGAAPSGFNTQCASESGTCAFTGTQTVAFGMGGEYVYKTFTGSAPCTVAAFGTDPVFGVAKSCYLTSSASSANAVASNVNTVHVITPNANTTVCNIYCDGRDPAVANGDRQAATATVWSRSLVLHISDGDDMAWASINNGSPTDEVWLDRSFDGGQTWANGSKLGDTTIPAGYGGWRTLMFNADNPSARGVGALRACGKAGDRVEIACTPWARPTTHAGTPQAASATALMQYWIPTAGRWNSAATSWQDANALTALIDYMKRSGDSTYSYAIAATYNDNLTSADFTGTYIDDTGWWGLAWLQAYHYTGDSRYLHTAEYDASYMSQYWDGTCGGGVWWSTARTAKNAIANELYLELNAALHLAVPGDTAFLSRAQQEWTWFAQSGLINSSSLVNDGLNLSTCQNAGDLTYTYNQGVILTGLADLYLATGQSSLVARAQSIATAATTRLATNGILVDPCEAGWCANDGYSFKGVFVRDLREFATTVGTNAYNAFLATQASSILAKDADLDGQSGLYWAGPLSALGFANQQSALDALTAAS